jgi:hypothetical protein
VGTDLIWQWGHVIAAGVANGILAVILFSILDRLKQRT